MCINIKRNGLKCLMSLSMLDLSPWPWDLYILQLGTLVKLFASLCDTASEVTPGYDGQKV